MAVRNAAFKSAVCKYKSLTDDEIIIAEEKAWKDRQAEIKAEIKCAMEEGIQKAGLRVNTVKKSKMLLI